MILRLRAAGHESFSRAALMKAAPATILPTLRQSLAENLAQISNISEKQGLFAVPPGARRRRFSLMIEIANLPTFFQLSFTLLSLLTFIFFSQDV
jgi:hypothetical protein